MKILMVGAGATGGYFGGRLHEGGRDVTFLVREGRAQKLRDRGLRITGPDGSSHVEAKITTAGTLTEHFDVILFSVKAAGLAGAIEDLAPAVGPDTVIIPFLNGMGHMDALASAFGAEKVLGGVVRILATLSDDGDVLQLGPMAMLDFGEQSGPPSPRVMQILDQLQVPGFQARAVPDALASMWHKWAFIVAAGAVTCLMRGPIGPIVAAPGGLDFVHAVLAEVASVAAAAGFEVPEQEATMAMDMLTQPGSAFTSSLYRDAVAGLPHEGEHLLGDFTRRAHELGVATPLIDLALLQLRVGA